jgi:hypothetical protein
MLMNIASANLFPPNSSISKGGLSTMSQSTSNAPPNYILSKVGLPTSMYTIEERLPQLGHQSIINQ